MKRTVLMLALSTANESVQKKEFFCSVLKSYRAYNSAGYRVLLATPKGVPLCQNVEDLVDPFHGVNYPLDARTLPLDDAKKFRAVYILTDADKVKDVDSEPMIASLIDACREVNLVLVLQSKQDVRVLQCGSTPSDNREASEDVYESYTKSLLDAMNSGNC